MQIVYLLKGDSSEFQRTQSQIEHCLYAWLYKVRFNPNHMSYNYIIVNCEGENIIINPQSIRCI